MHLNLRHPLVQHLLNELLDDLQESNAAVVAGVAFGDKNHNGEKHLPRDFSRVPDVADELEEKAPGVAHPLVPLLSFLPRLLFVLRFLEPRLEVLCPHL